MWVLNFYKLLYKKKKNIFNNNEIINFALQSSLCYIKSLDCRRLVKALHKELQKQKKSNKKSADIF